MLARLLIALAFVAAAPAASAQGARDWTRTVVETAEGGYRMGNPDAPVKLVEYLSLTCPHCAHFAEEGVPALLRDHVRTGRVSLEYRNYVLNGYDLAAAMISRCAAPRDYFALNHALLAAQGEWTGRVRAMPAEERSQLAQAEPLEAVRRIVALIGLDAIAARHGVTPAAARACLADRARLERLEAMRRAADAAGVSGTPTFAINGRILERVHDWAALEPRLRDAR